MKDRTQTFLIICFSALIIIPSFLFFIGPEFIQARLFYKCDIAERGAIGDAFGGILGPIIGVIASILTFMAFYIQYQANKQQREQFGKQANDILIERFENRFFELIRLHRENVEEQNIQNIVTGRKVFTTYYFELRYIYVLLESKFDENWNDNYSKEQLTNIAYLIFFFGIGHVTENVFQHINSNLLKETFFKETINKLKEQKENFKQISTEIKLASTRPGLVMPTMPELQISNRNKKAIFIQNYEPFTGHGTKIGHYFRHLYQTVKYVDSQNNENFTDMLKYDYVKILRAQLSNFEQVLFYYNSISDLGKEWNLNGYIIKYHLITNLPLSFADFGILPSEKFANEILEQNDFFDWQNLGK